MSGRRIAGTASPVIVIALKRNGAYPDDIQLFAVGRCSRCLKERVYRRIGQSDRIDGAKELWLT